MLTKIKMDICKALKRKKKITDRNGKEFVVHCKYERMGEFCFICGLVTHTYRFCRKFLEDPGNNLVKEWGAWLHAPPRRLAGQVQSKWLRDDGKDDWNFKNDTANRSVISGMDGADSGGEEDNEGRDCKGKDKANVIAAVFQNLNNLMFGATKVQNNRPGD